MQVAVKVIDKKKAREDAYVCRNMRRESRLLQQIKHRHIIQLFEVRISLIYLLRLRWRRIHYVVTSTARFTSLETIMRYLVEWSQFAVYHFFGNLTCAHKITALRKEIILKAPSGE